jgi:hypothetical protein
MRYIIYKGINENEFTVLKEKLNNIERISSPLMQMHDFFLNRESYDEALALDYLHKDEKFQGNIGLKYIEKVTPSDLHLFEFYILKAYDKGELRFYQRVIIKKKNTLDEVYGNIYKPFNECLVIYESIKEDEMVENIKLRG